MQSHCAIQISTSKKIMMMNKCFPCLANLFFLQTDDLFILVMSVNVLFSSESSFIC